MSLRDGTVEIDLCKRCTLLWFDPGELERFPPIPTTALRGRQYAEELRASNRKRAQNVRRDMNAALSPILSQYPTDAWVAVLGEAIREWGTP
jgi:Zn-finger nucleic acid-binding protein